MIEPLSALFATTKPLFFLLAGPNGAGKSTFRRKYLDPLGLTCIDPDQVARSLLGRDPKNKKEAITATIEATAQVREEFSKHISCGLETVLSDTKGLKIALLEEARQLGYHVGVIFIGLDDPQLSIARVMDTLGRGSHPRAPDAFAPWRDILVETAATDRFAEATRGHSQIHGLCGLRAPLSPATAAPRSAMHSAAYSTIGICRLRRETMLRL